MSEHMHGTQAPSFHAPHDACRCPPADFKRPGHIFPLRYHPGGVLVRPGHTEAGVDLARLAGCYPSGCLSEIVDRRDGSMARLMQLLEFAKQHGLKCITIAQLIRHRLQHEEVVQEVSQAPVSLPLSGYLTPQKFRCTMRVFRCLASLSVALGHYENQQYFSMRCASTLVVVANLMV